MDKRDVIVCRCSDLTLADLEALFNTGYKTFEELKRIARIGMGPCQGTTCGPIVRSAIHRRFKEPIERIPLHRARPFNIGIKLGAIKEAADDES